ncbi:MAG: hypothetical protein D6719_10605 [Candidatus Dadabacteria bacterium]|nr:MAG: hypothetical protein D6719_10605 [Candidatus Dadabacteria bacterium]
MAQNSDRIISVYRTKHLPVSALAGVLPESTLKYDWYGSEIVPPLYYSIAIDTEHLFFSARRESPAFLNPAYRMGQYVEGLWNYDVVELFISDPKKSSYQEINLAPNGVWWSQAFSSYRQREEDYATPAGVKTTCIVLEKSWETSIYIPLNNLSVQFEPESGLYLNICAILGKDDRRYLSAVKLNSDEPDFHPRRQLPKVIIVEV